MTKKKAWWATRRRGHRLTDEEVAEIRRKLGITEDQIGPHAEPQRPARPAGSKKSNVDLSWLEEFIRRAKC